MNMSLLRAPLLALGFGALAFGQASAPPVKVGIIHIQNAIIQTKDGQKAAADLNEKLGPTAEAGRDRSRTSCSRWSSSSAPAPTR